MTGKPPAGGIASPRNERVKLIVRLSKRHEREKTGLMVVEGLREIERALSAGVEIVEAYHCPSAGAGPETLALLERLGRAKTPVVEVGAAAFRKIAYREESGGIVVTARIPSRGLDALPRPGNPLYLVVDAVEKPGNLGAIMRSADGAGADGVIVTDESADPWNPNAIRSSIGTIFTVPIAVAPAAEAIDWLRERGVTIFVATLDGSIPYAREDLAGSCALVVGSEDRGVGEAWLASAQRRLRIPMRGAADSLNVSAAAAILLYEALRQRENSVILRRGETAPKAKPNEGA